MFWRFGAPLLICAVFAFMLLGWGIAWWYDRKADRNEKDKKVDHDS